MTTSGSKLNQWAKTVLLATWWKRLWRVLEESHKKFTNHSARKTTVSKLKKANVERSDIVKRSVQSLDGYDEADEEEQRRLSSAISKRNYENPSAEKKQMTVSDITTTVAKHERSRTRPAHRWQRRKKTNSRHHFQVFKLRISPWIQPWWGPRNRPWWTHSTTVKCLSSLAARSELRSSSWDFKTTAQFL